MTAGRMPAELYLPFDYFSDEIVYTKSQIRTVLEINQLINL